MNLIDFAKTLPADFEEPTFIEHLKKSLDLDKIKDLSESEINNLFDAVQYLADYLLLVREYKGFKVEEEGSPYVRYTGPYIQNILTNQGDGASDFEQIQTFGVGGADKYLK